MAVLIAWAARSTPLTFGILAWMLLGAVLARSGILSRFSSVPPPIALLFGGGFVATIALGMSRWVGQLIELPLAILLAAQSFRILVEILIHTSSTIGLAPIQMTWSGYNFDIFTGVTASTRSLRQSRTRPTGLPLELPGTGAPDLGRRHRDHQPAHSLPVNAA
jgi:hypothetical protein